MAAQSRRSSMVISACRDTSRRPSVQDRKRDSKAPQAACITWELAFEPHSGRGLVLRKNKWSICVLGRTSREPVQADTRYLAMFFANDLTAIINEWLDQKRKSGGWSAIESELVLARGHFHDDWRSVDSTYFPLRKQAWLEPAVRYLHYVPIKGQNDSRMCLSKEVCGLDRLGFKYRFHSKELELTFRDESLRQSVDAEFSKKWHTRVLGCTLAREL